MAGTIPLLRRLLALFVALIVVVMLWFIQASYFSNTIDIKRAAVGWQKEMLMSGVHLVEKRDNDEVMEIKAEQAAVSANESQTRLMNFTLISHTQSSGPVTITANRGMVHNLTNNMTAEGAILVRDSKGRALVTDSMTWNTTGNEIWTNDWVYIFGSRFCVRAKGMVVDTKNETVTLLQNVVATFLEQP